MCEALDRIRAETMRHYGFGVEAMRQIRICSYCGNTSPAHQQFCTECGHRLPDRTLYDVYKQRHKACPHCDIVVADETGYCPQCGNKITCCTVETE